MDTGADRAFRVLGFGSPLVDLRAEVSPDFLRLNVPGGAGGTVHVSHEELRELLSKLPAPPATAPGGSAGNTIFALNRLGVEAELLGKMGDDAGGRFYIERLQAAGGSGKYIFRSPDGATGTCLALTTPDGERTMRSYLGASLGLTGAEIGQVDFRAFDLVLVEGYMASSAAFDGVLERARSAGCRIAFDPGSFELAARCRECFIGVIEKYVDLLLINRAEAESLCGRRSDGELLKMLAGISPEVVLKLGAAGAMIKSADGETTVVPAAKIKKVVDTTAAGDMFAAGFIFGIARRRPPARCGQLGALLAAEAVQVSGTELPEEVWEKLKKSFHGGNAD